MARELISGDAAIKAVKPGDPRKRLNDGRGLYLLLFVKGGSHGWRLDSSNPMALLFVSKTPAAFFGNHAQLKSILLGRAGE